MVVGMGMLNAVSLPSQNPCVFTVNVVIHKEPSRRGAGPCSAVKWICEAGYIHLFAGFSTGKVASFTLAEGMLRKASAVSLGVAVSVVT